MLRDSSATGQSLARDSKDKVVELEAQVQSLRWQLAVAGADTRGRSGRAAGSNGHNASPVAQRQPRRGRPAFPTTPARGAYGSEIVVHPRFKGASPRFSEGGRSPGTHARGGVGGRRAMPQHQHQLSDDRASARTIAASILRHGTPGSGERVAALRAAAARIAAGEDV